MNAFVDAKDCYEAAGRYVNHAFDPAQRNAHFQRHPEEHWALLIASREIEPDEEIYASYSDDYWRSRGIDPKTGYAFIGVQASPSRRNFMIGCCSSLTRTRCGTNVHYLACHQTMLNLDDMLLLHGMPPLIDS